MEKLFEKLNEIIREYDNFIIMGHKDPDLDSLGSSLGLCEIIESFNKKEEVDNFLIPMGYELVDTIRKGEDYIYKYNEAYSIYR